MPEPFQYASRDDFFIQRRLVRATAGAFLLCIVAPVAILIWGSVFGLMSDSSDCWNLLPKLERAVGLFPRSEICIANKHLAINFYLFISSYSVLLMYILISVISHRKWKAFRIILLQNCRMWVFPGFCFVIVFISLYSYLNYDAGFRISFFELDGRKSISGYAWAQIFFLMISVNFFAFAGTLSLYIAMLQAARIDDRE
jgi:hypothetical protein